MVLIGCHRSVAPVKDADVAGLVPSWCATSHRRQRRRRHQPRRRRQATLGFDRPQDSNAKGVPDDSATPLVSESVLGVFLGSPAATPRLESETPVAFDLRSAHATRPVVTKCIWVISTNSTAHPRPPLSAPVGLDPAARQLVSYGSAGASPSQSCPEHWRIQLEPGKLPLCHRRIRCVS